MTVSEDEIQTDDKAIEVAQGSRVPFTQVGDWVLMSSVSAQAKLLYALLSAHLNIKSGSREVWPGKDVLAGWMGLKNARSVTAYMNELVALGAIEVHQRRDSRNMKLRNRYKVNGMPPKGLTTPVTFGDFYEARNQERDAKAAGGNVVSRSAPRPGQGKDVSAGRDDVQISVPRTADDLHPVVPPSAHELDEVPSELEEGGNARESEERPAASGTPTSDEPPSPSSSSTPKADWTRPETWMCSEHLALVGDDPGADRPACGKCARVVAWAKRKRDDAAADERRDQEAAGAQARSCQRHDVAGWVIDPETGMPFEPAVKCTHDHRCDAEAVRDRLARVRAGEREFQQVASSAVRARARKLAGVKPSQRPSRADWAKPAGATDPAAEVAS